MACARAVETAHTARTKAISSSTLGGLSAARCSGCQGNTTITVELQ